jgi:hypothetical protein
VKEREDVAACSLPAAPSISGSLDLVVRRRPWRSRCCRSATSAPPTLLPTHRRAVAGSAVTSSSVAVWISQPRARASPNPTACGRLLPSAVRPHPSRGGTTSSFPRRSAAVQPPPSTAVWPPPPAQICTGGAGGPGRVEVMADGGATRVRQGRGAGERKGNAESRRRAG